jgi:hypothetical protein
MKEREVAQAHEADKESKRERTRWANEIGSDARNTPVVLSRPRVLDVEFDFINCKP